MVNDPKLRGLYGRLTGLKYSIPSGSVCRALIGSDYNDIVENIGGLLKEDLSSFILPRTEYYQNQEFCHSEILKSKVEQLIGYLNAVHFVSESIVEIGSLYNIISDADLKQRCSDLLTAQGSFDRAVNQATLVLEDRIRTKAGLQNENIVGKDLVNKALNADVTKAIIVISDDPQEHEGIGHICRGIVGAFRNPTHHQLLDHYKREDALRLCGFIDQLLSIIDQAKVRK